MPTRFETSMPMAPLDEAAGAACTPPARVTIAGALPACARLRRAFVHARRIALALALAITTGASAAADATPGSTGAGRSVIRAGAASAATPPAPTRRVPGATAGCANCGVVLSVRRVPIRRKPSWVIEKRVDPHEGHVGVRDPTLVRVDPSLQRAVRYQWEVVLMMSGGQTMRHYQAFMPGFSPGAQVRVAEGMLLPP